MDMRNRVVSQQIVRGVRDSAYIDQVKSSTAVAGGTHDALVGMGLLATGIGAIIADRNAATAAQDASFASSGRQMVLLSIQKAKNLLHRVHQVLLAQQPMIQPKHSVLSCS